MQRPAHGLYLPELEHDACGVGFVVHLRGQKSHGIVAQGLEVLDRLSHRAATGRDPETGDGAGILIQLPHSFFAQAALPFALPPKGRYAVAQVFLPPEPERRRACEQIFAEVVESAGQRVLGWRDVPTDPAHLGRDARAVLPAIRQLFVQRRRVLPGAFERELYVIRKKVENQIAASGSDPEGRFHVASFSAETLIYKGLLLPRQLPRFYEDLAHGELASAIALVHSRFSTNTFPTWELAQPFRFIAHNGEINTLRGNRNWMDARRSMLRSARLGVSLDALHPIVVPGKSDSAQFDNMAELLFHAGRSLPHALMMMIPEAWEGDSAMSDDRRAFYEHAASLLEPWDGPAAIAFTDGTIVGATLDRNGLRPARYLVTEDDRVVLASETGVLDVPDAKVKLKGRLQPGRMFVVDTREGRILDDAEVKREPTQRWPYRRWLDRHVSKLEQLPVVTPPAPLSDDARLQLQRAFGYSDEDLRVLLAPMAETGHEGTGSMGMDAPLAVLSDQAPSLFDYFHQLFAQVTNPPIDPIREKLVMSVATTLGPEGNTLEDTPEPLPRLALPSPVLTHAQLATLSGGSDEAVFDPQRLSLLFALDQGPSAMAKALEALVDAAVAAVNEGSTLLILSDRGADANHAPIPVLLAVAAVNQRLVRDGIRMHAGLVCETAEVREVHHVALLVGYGATAVNPYLALETVEAMARAGDVKATPEQAVNNYVKSCEEGLLKVMSKMGISTLQSYRGAQIFEAVGLDSALVDAHFTGTPSRLSGVGLNELEREARERHARGFAPGQTLVELELPEGGKYAWRRRGEPHKWNPSTIAFLQSAVQRKDTREFEKFCLAADDESQKQVTLRSLLATRPMSKPIAIDEVEPVSEIVRRFVTGAMSFGSISAEAHETLAIAMNRLGGRSNSGEGGEETRRFPRDSDGTWRRSAIKQVASARFGVTTEYLVNADELQIKVAQGAKPGEGGQLPGHKVDERIAAVRWSTPGVTLISPPPHHDIYSIEDLAQLIYDLQAVNGDARVSVKLVSEVGVGTVAAGVAKAGAGAVVISGFEGGTGASPLSSIKHAGLPWELGLAETQQVLVQNGLRERIRVQVDGGLRTPRDVIIAALLGAEEFGMATASLIALGCIMLRKCHLNTCSVGIATQDPELRKHFHGSPEHVETFFTFIAEGVRAQLAKLGLRSLDEAVGRVDLLQIDASHANWKARKLELAPLLAKPNAADDAPKRCVKEQRKQLDDLLDPELLERAKNAIEKGKSVRFSIPVCNRNRAVGARLSGEIAKRTGDKGLADDAIHAKLRGSAGQSFGAFLAPGVTLELIGDSNDYLGKGLSGGRIIVRPHKDSRFVPEENVIVGNTVLYGATRGEVFVRGLAGERFAVRNSGAHAVVEGVGDHGCEYMTGGRVVVLGPTGRNFAAGMSGGIAYVLDREGRFSARCNREMVELGAVIADDEKQLLRELVDRHRAYTGSKLAQRLLARWEENQHLFVRVMPRDYAKVLARAKAAAEAPKPAAEPRRPDLKVLHG